MAIKELMIWEEEGVTSAGTGGSNPMVSILTELLKDEQVKAAWEQIVPLAFNTYFKQMREEGIRD